MARRALRGRRAASSCSPGAPVGWPEGLALGRELVVARDRRPRTGSRSTSPSDGGAAKEIHRHPDVIGFSDSELHLEGFDHVGLSADETLVCVEMAQDGDNIHRQLLVLDPRSGERSASLADGPGLGVRAFAWSPVPGDQRMLFTHEREDLTAARCVEPDDRRAFGPRARPARRCDPGRLVAGCAIDPVRPPVPWAGSPLPLELERGTLTEIAHPAGRDPRRPRTTRRPRLAAGVERRNGARAAGRRRVQSSWLRAPGGVREGRPYREWLFRNPAGDAVQGWLATPPGDGPFPLYLKVHGGPRLALPRHLVAGRPGAGRRGVRRRDGELPRLDRLRPGAGATTSSATSGSPRSRTSSPVATTSSPAGSPTPNAS